MLMVSYCWCGSAGVVVLWVVVLRWQCCGESARVIVVGCQCWDCCAGGGSTEMVVLGVSTR